MKQGQSGNGNKFAFFVVSLALTMLMAGSAIFAAERYLTSQYPSDEGLAILVASQVVPPLLGFLIGLAIRATIFEEYKKAKVRYLVTLGAFLSLLLVTIWLPVPFPLDGEHTIQALEMMIFLVLIVPGAIVYATIGALIAALVLRLP